MHQGVPQPRLNRSEASLLSPTSPTFHGFQTRRMCTAHRTLAPPKYVMYLMSACRPMVPRALRLTFSVLALLPMNCQESNWVLPGRMMVGAYPSAQEDDLNEEILTSLLRLGLQTFVCLQAE